MRVVEIIRHPVIDGKRRFRMENHIIYTQDEADQAGIIYHHDWRSAFWNDLIKVGDFVLTEVEPFEVIPVIGVRFGKNFPTINTPNGTFNPESKRPLTGEKFKNRHCLRPDKASNKVSNELYRSGAMDANAEVNMKLALAAFIYMRSGDPVAAYSAAYHDQAFFKKMTHRSIR